MSEAPTLDQLESESAHETMRSVMAEMGMEQPSEPSEPEAEPTEPEQTERVRDEKGRFVAKEGSGEPETLSGGEDTPEPIDAAEEPSGAQETPSEPEDDIEPPADWKADAQEAFDKLPKEVKSLVIEKSRRADEVYQKAAQAVQYYYNLEQTLAPRREAWHRSGMDEVGAIRQLLSLSDMATQNPVQFAQMFIRERRLSPEHVFPQLAKKPDDEYADPEVASLKQEIAALKQELGTTQQTWQQQAQQAQQQQTQAAQQEIQGQVQAFSTAMDERGRLKHPHFQEVQGLMSHLIRSGSASDLESAYDMACHAHPEVRAKIAAAQRRTEQQELARKQREKAEAARQAGSSISGTPGSGVETPESSGDLREDLRREARKKGLDV